MPRFTVTQVAPGFEPLAEAFQANFQRNDDYREVGAAFCLLRHGEVLANLAGGVTAVSGENPWRQDTLVNVYSTTKAVVALAIAILVERGVLDYEAPVNDYWRDFRGHGKEKLTVAELLSHQAGLPGFQQAVSLQDLYDSERMENLLAQQAPIHPPGENTCYHPITFGFLANALVRHATGRDLRYWVDTLFHRELGLDVFIGCPGAESGRVATLIPPTAADPSDLEAMSEVVRLALTNPVIPAEVAATAAWRKAALPAANGHASAAGLAHLFSMLTDGQSLDAQTLKALFKVRSSRQDALLQMPMAWCAGLVRNDTGLYGPVKNVYGHSGWGGSFVCVDPDKGLSFAYVCNRMGADLVGDPRARALCEAVYHCGDNGA
ncbi:serine hydrolase domain-containing protein [Haliea sp.]